jgi:transcriptional regulator with XRE-family HTH domain
MASQYHFRKPRTGCHQMTPNELREWRKAKGMTQGQGAELAGVSLRTYKRWELGELPVPRLLELYIQGESK